MRRLRCVEEYSPRRPTGSALPLAELRLALLGKLPPALGGGTRGPQAKLEDPAGLALGPPSAGGKMPSAFLAEQGMPEA